MGARRELPEPPPGFGAIADRTSSMTGSAWPAAAVCPWCGGAGTATVMGVALDDCCHPYGTPGSTAADA